MAVDLHEHFHRVMQRREHALVDMVRLTTDDGTASSRLAVLPEVLSSTLLPSWKHVSDDLNRKP